MRTQDNSLIKQTKTNTTTNPTIHRYTAIYRGCPRHQLPDWWWCYGFSAAYLPDISCRHREHSEYNTASSSKTTASILHRCPAGLVSSFLQVSTLNAVCCPTAAGGTVLPSNTSFYELRRAYEACPAPLAHRPRSLVDRTCLSYSVCSLAYWT